MGLPCMHSYKFTPLGSSGTSCEVAWVCVCATGAKEKEALKGLETIAPLVRTVEETPEPIPTEVHGTIPSWIDGNFLRNGPGKFEFGNRQ